MGNELVISHQEVGITIHPEETIEMASIAAKALERVVSFKPKPVILNGEQYLEFEDLQLLAQFYGYAVKTGDASLVDIDGVKGAKAHADLIDLKTGYVIGGAEAYCMRDEDKWNTRPKYEWQGEGTAARRGKIADEPVPWFQLASMAQTRAGAKALRNRLAWVVVLAGYKPTPAEEMTENTVSDAVKERRTIDKSEHYCPIHSVSFFKKGRMTGFSHPIEGTEPQQWCNEPPPISELHSETPAPTPKPLENAPVKPQGDKVADQRLLYDTIKSHTACKTDKSVESWLGNVAHIDMARVESEPGTVLAELSHKHQWG